MVYFLQSRPISPFFNPVNFLKSPIGTLPNHLTHLSRRSSYDHIWTMLRGSVLGTTSMRSKEAVKNWPAGKPRLYDFVYLQADYIFVSGVNSSTCLFPFCTYAYKCKGTSAARLFSKYVCTYNMYVLRLFHLCPRIQIDILLRVCVPR